MKPYFQLAKSGTSDRHGSRTSLDFLRGLNQHTQRTAASCKEIVHERSLDSVLLSNLGSDLRHEEYVGDRDKGGQTAQDTAIAHSLGVLSSGVTVAEIRYKARTTVIKATKQSMRPLLCHSRSLIQRNNGIKRDNRPQLRGNQPVHVYHNEDGTAPSYCRSTDSFVETSSNVIDSLQNVA